MLLICISALSMALGPISAYRKNILPNSSFESWCDTTGYDTSRVSIPSGWLTSALYKPSTAIRSEHAHTGNHTIQLSIFKEDGSVGGIGTYANITRGTSYTLNLYYDCSERASGYVRIGQFNERDSIIGIAVYHLKASNGYTLFDTSFAAHQDAVKFWIDCSISAESDSTGILSCEDVELCKSTK